MAEMEEGRGGGPWDRRRARFEGGAPDRPNAPQHNAPQHDGGPLFAIPPVLGWTLGLMWIVYAAIALAPGLVIEAIDAAFALSPRRFVAGPEANGGYFGMIAPLFGHMFVHADLMHIGMNSLWFLAFGAPVLNRLSSGGASGPALVGRVGGGASAPAGGAASLLFLTFFLLSGVAGALFFIALNANQGALLVGASGGVSGLLGGLVRFISRRGPLFATGFRPLAPLSDRSVLLWAGVITALNISTAFAGLSGPGGANIAWEAHLGGFCFGLLAFPFFDAIARRNMNAP